MGVAMLKKISEQLRSLPLFSGLEPSQLERLASGAMELAVPRGTIVFRESDACTGLHLVEKGQIKLSLLTDRGQEKVLRLVGEQESFGEPALFLEQCHLMTAEAITDSTLLHIAKDVVLNEVSRNAAFGRRVIGDLCRQLHERTLDLQSYLLLSGRQRVVKYLLDQLPSKVNGSPAVVMLPAKKGVIASRLNLTHEHFSRILHELAIDALIQVDGRAIRIPDLHRLRTSQVG